MHRVPAFAALMLMLAQAPAAHAANENQECGAAVLTLLAGPLKVAHFVPGPGDDGKDPAGVVMASSCKRMPDDPRLTLAAVAWDAHEADSKALAIAIVDESAGSVAALLKDDLYEDAATQVNNGSLRLDTAPYELAPGVRAFGLDIFSSDRSCGDGGTGPSRTLYVRDGKTLRPVLVGLAMGEFAYLRGNQPRCVADQKEAETAIIEDDDVVIALGAPGKNGWRDLMLTETARRSDHKPTRKPLHVRVPYDGDAYDLKAFGKAHDQWRK